jgi:hypothetical protein
MAPLVLQRDVKLKTDTRVDRTYKPTHRSKRERRLEDWKNMRIERTNERTMTASSHSIYGNKSIPIAIAYRTAFDRKPIDHVRLQVPIAHSVCLTAPQCLIGKRRGTTNALLRTRKVSDQNFQVNCLLKQYSLQSEEARRYEASNWYVAINTKVTRNSKSSDVRSERRTVRSVQDLLTY